MTHQIQGLDHTKDNLVTSVTTLKRLQMLTKLHSQLELLLRERQYREIAHSLPAALELAEHFRQLRTLGHVARLSHLIADFEAKLRAQAFEELQRFARGEQVDDLRWACRASGDRDRLVGWYTQHALQGYEQVFALGSEAAGLDNIDRRFAMLRNILNKHRDEAFPEEWRVGCALALAACDKTRQDIAALQFGASSGSVQLLLNSLQQSTEFEAYLRRRFPESDEFGSPISRAFIPHLQVWVEFHERTLGDMLRGYASHTWNEDVDGSDVLASSTDLFLYYRNAMDQMAKLSVGAPLVALSRVFAGGLVRYAGYLQSQAVAVGAAQGAAQASSSEERQAAEKILRTAAYCISTTQQLESSIFNLVEPELQGEIDLSEPTDRLQGVVKTCLEAYTAQVEDALKLSWREMANVNWQRLQHANDESSYARELAAVLARAPAASLKPQHQRVVCDAVVRSVAFNFLQVAMARIRPVSAVIAEQLLLDFYLVKSALVQLLDDAKYRERTAATVARVEAVLKVLLTQPEPASLVQNYLLLTKDGSLANFRKVLEAKGLRPQRYVERWAEVEEAREGLVETWPLSEIKTALPRVTSPPPENKFDFKRIGGFLRRDPASPLLR